MVLARHGTTRRSATRSGCRCGQGCSRRRWRSCSARSPRSGSSRARFFGRDSISFLFILPIALPGIITGLALNSFFVIWGVSFSLWTIVIGHATFCVVIVYNNVIARLRRTSGSFFEASADLGATGFQTFRYVTLPVVGTALVAGGLLAFALSWDEIVVTYFTAGAQNTLPLLLFGFIRQGQNLPDRQRDRTGRDRGP